MATGALIRKPESSGTYSYSSKPRVIQPKQKYREDVARPANIMFDRRVVRGNTYALHTLPASAQPDPMEIQRQQELRRRTIARRRAREQMRVHSPPAVEGRRHTEVQTELYLEEITDRIEEADVHTQTDAFLDRPPTPLFIPAKTGIDASTQIMEGDLFNFELEVRPILEVLVGKTMEQALLEVEEEEELAALREQQRIFEENRNAEFVETQRLEEQERRRREEKDRRKRQQHEALMKEKETAEKIAARAFAQSYLSDLVPAVFSNLSQNGFFYDPVERDLETNFMPWLLTELGMTLDSKLVSRGVLDEIIKDVVRRKLGMFTPEPSQAGSLTEKEMPVTESEDKDKGEHEEASASEEKDREGVETGERKGTEAEKPQDETQQPSSGQQPPAAEEAETKDDQGDKPAITAEIKEDESEPSAPTEGPKADQDDLPSSADETKADIKDEDKSHDTHEPKDGQLEGSDDTEPKSDEKPAEDEKEEESEPVPAETLKKDSSKTEEEPETADEQTPDKDQTTAETGEDDKQQDPPDDLSEEAKEQ